MDAHKINDTHKRYKYDLFRKRHSRDKEAKIDGCGEIRTFASIAFPIVKPGFAALAIFTFINTWNDYFMQLVMLSSRDNVQYARLILQHIVCYFLLRSCQLIISRLDLQNRGR